jgi:transcriptional regulator with XRE-family HTH domain
MRNDLGRILYARNLREHDVARRAGLAQSHLNRIKNRRVVPSLETALRICAALGLPVEAVFSLDPDHRARRRPAGRVRARAGGGRRERPGTVASRSAPGGA